MMMNGLSGLQNTTFFYESPDEADLFLLVFLVFRCKNVIASRRPTSPRNFAA
jgi:hypothetical protein